MNSFILQTLLKQAVFKVKFESAGKYITYPQLPILCPCTKHPTGVHEVYSIVLHFTQSGPRLRSLLSVNVLNIWILLILTDNKHFGNGFDSF